MKNILALLIATLLLSWGLPARAAGSDEAAARAAAEAWLKLIDAGHYAQAYDRAASPMKQTSTKDNFQKMFAGSRSQFGAVTSRAFKSATATTSLPGAPPGHYVVILYTTSFAAKPGLTETVTPMLDTDGKWHVSGYYIRHDMKYILALLVVLSLGASALAASSDEAAAQAAAESWLTLLDAGQCTQAASLMKSGMSKADLAATRAPYGALRSRILKAANATSTVYGAPPGRYVVMAYSTVFAARPLRTEVMTIMLDTDGQWRVRGYFIK